MSWLRRQAQERELLNVLNMHQEQFAALPTDTRQEVFEAFEHVNRQLNRPAWLQNRREVARLENRDPLYTFTHGRYTVVVLHAHGRYAVSQVMRLEHVVLLGGGT